MDKNDLMGVIIWMISVWGCAILFTGIGLFAWKREEPMWFWSGSTVDPDTVSDIPAYNREMMKMWVGYSIPFWITGLTFIWYPAVSAIAMGIAATLGIGWLVWRYHKIKKKYER